MALVLGIDAAWTEAGSSGVALLECNKNERRLVACAPSYASFVAYSEKTPIDWHKPASGPLDVAELLRAAARLGCAPIDVVAIDMPIARTSITGRRTADRMVSEAFGSAWASTHSPTPKRPGSYGHRVTMSFLAAEYSLATKQTTPSPRSLIEVYPLAALVRLMKLPKRPPYKTAKRYREWGKVTPSERIDLLLNEWTRIVDCLGQGISELCFKIPGRSEVVHLNALKPYEDALDAVISAYVGALFLEGAAEPYGDTDAAIWVPKPDCIAHIHGEYLAAVQTTLSEWGSSSDANAFGDL